VPEGFRSLASVFALREAAELQAAPEPAPRVVVVPEPASTVAYADERISDLLDAFVAELARLRASAVERFEETAESMLADLAARVLGRELSVAPPDLEALIAAAMDELSREMRLAVRVSSSDAKRLGMRWPVEIDTTLGPGDFCVDVDDGRYEAALQTRLEAMLASHRVAL
jgi:flagellar biosynthesis/type III secretory pathway protein FliH